MEYRKLPHGDEMLSVVGMGLGGIHKNSDEELEAIFRKAIDNGINFFDLCGGAKNVFAPFGRAIAGRREQVFVQMHFGCVYNNEKGEYGWGREFDVIRDTIQWELDEMGTDYIDFGFLHCVDTDEDYDELVRIGVLDYMKQLKVGGTIRHIGFSSHTPSVCNRILDTGVADLMMFSINPAYDFEKGDEYGIGTVSERFGLFKRCEVEGVGISVMKPFHAGKLLSAETSPFGQALTHYQCIQYSLDRPGVLAVVPGVRNMADLDMLLGFSDASAQEKDYSIVGSFTVETVTGTCVYCNHCQPCPAGIDIGLVNKYYDLAQVGDTLAAGHYDKLTVKADACLHCGHCESRCPFGVKQETRMKEIAVCFAK